MAAVEGAALGGGLEESVGDPPVLGSTAPPLLGAEALEESTGALLVAGAVGAAALAPLAPAELDADPGADALAYGCTMARICFS